MISVFRLMQGLSRRPVIDRDAHNFTAWAFALIVLGVPVLLAAGVYWLHQQPVGVGSRNPDGNVIEVRLVVPMNGDTTPSPTREVEPTDHPQPETLIENPQHSIPSTATASLEQPEQIARPPSARPASEQKAQSGTEIRAAAFQRALLSHIARFRHYPEQARRDGAHGIVHLLFTMRRDGSVSEMKVASSSGYNLLDGAAIETIRKAQPLPQIPAQLPEHLSILVPIAFELSQ